MGLNATYELYYILMATKQSIDQILINGLVNHFLSRIINLRSLNERFLQSRLLNSSNTFFNIQKRCITGWNKAGEMISCEEVGFILHGVF